MELHIDWNQAPQGARWWVMDRDGRAHWFGEPDIVMQTSFWFSDPIPAPAFDYVGDWRASLVERPAQEWNIDLSGQAIEVSSSIGA